MAVFGKKADGAAGHDDMDFVRIPSGTRILAGGDGKLSLHFNGDVSLGESLPDIAEIVCGRNLSIDAGVTIRAEAVRVKSALEIEAGSRLIAKELEVERLVARKGHIEARSVSAGQVELESTRLVAERVTARENVVIDRGEVEIGAVVAQALTISKGTIANILITEVARLEGAITKGGYENFAEFLAKVLLYHPEVLNDRFAAEARRGPGAVASAATPNAGVLVHPESPDEMSADPAALQRLAQEGQRLKSYYTDKEMPREIAELIACIESHKLADVRRSLTPIYNKLAPVGKMPDPVMQSFGAIQKLFRESEKRREARPA